MTSMPEPKTPAEALGRDLKVAATEAYNLFLASHRDVAGKDLPDEERTSLQDELARLMAEAIKKVMGTAPREVLEECFSRVWTRHAIDEIQTRIDQKAILDMFRQSMAEIVDKHAEQHAFPHPFQKADRKDGKTKNETEKKKYAKPSKGRKRKTVA